MPTKLQFTRRPLEGIAENKDAERELKRMHKEFKRGELVPESVWLAANAMLTQRSRRLSFDTKEPYVRAMREVLDRDPHLRLGVGPYLYDKEFPGITFIEEATTDDDEHTD